MELIGNVYVDLKNISSIKKSTVGTIEGYYNNRNKCVILTTLNNHTIEIPFKTFIIENIVEPIAVINKESTKEDICNFLEKYKDLRNYHTSGDEDLRECRAYDVIIAEEKYNLEYDKFYNEIVNKCKSIQDNEQL